MEYQVRLEYDPESGHYCGTVVGMPVVVDGRSKEEALTMLRTAIRLMLEEESRDFSPDDIVTTVDVAG